MSDFRVGMSGNGEVVGFSKNGNHLKVTIALDVQGYEVMTDIYCPAVGSSFRIGDNINAMIFAKEYSADGDGMLIGGLKLIKKAEANATTNGEAGNGRVKPAQSEE